MQPGRRFTSFLALTIWAGLTAGCGDDGGGASPDASDTPPIDAPGNPADASTDAPAPPTDGAPGADPDATPADAALVPDATPVIPDAAVIQPLCPVEPTVQPMLLVTRQTDLATYTLDGTLIDAVSVTGGSSESELRDVAADVCGNGDVFVYKGTFSPTIAHRTSQGTDWTHYDIDGFSTVNNVTYGGVAARDSFVYATDMATANPGGETKGVVRVDVSNGAETRFATNLDPIDLSLGWDGLLYVLHSNGTTVQRFDPATLVSHGTVQLAASVRAVAVIEDGAIYGASFNGDLHRFAADGSTQQTVPSGENNLSDIDIAVDGTVAVGSRFGDVVITNLALSPVSSFPTYTGTFGDPTFVSFVHTSGVPSGF